MCSTSTRLPADCVEFCTDVEHLAKFAVAEYKLDQTTNTKHGAIGLYQLLPSSK